MQPPVEATILAQSMRSGFMSVDFRGYMNTLSWQILRAEASMQTTDISKASNISDEMMAYLKYEAAQTGKTIAEIYREEVAAQAELAKITPSAVEIMKLSRDDGAPEWISNSEPDQYPF